jgi:putative toxin-antitoxin system antitoxin component (TIGR02293 family)
MPRFRARCALAGTWRSRLWHNQPMATLAHLPAFPALSEIDVRSVEAGLSLNTMTTFLDDAGLELKDIYDVIISARTLAQRRARGENLSRDESDRLARLIRIYDHTLRVFGNKEKSLRFLRLPKQRLGGRIPLELLRTEVGGNLVDGMLWQIADGVFV